MADESSKDGHSADQPARADKADPPSQSAAFKLGPDARIGSIVVEGSVAGRDVINITENLTYDVSGIGRNPYVGLASFTYETRAFYGGREQQVTETVDLLTAPGEELALSFVTGASGSGKSSFVQAGVVPALEAFYGARGRTVRWAVARPGRRPLSALGQALSSLGMPDPSDGDWPGLLRTAESLNLLLTTQTPAGQVNVLVLDQFEELFTQSDPGERDAFCAVLPNLASFNQGRTHVLATVRADYLPALFGVPALFALVKRNGIELRAMTPTELGQAIRRPLDELNRELGLDKRWDQALVQRLVDDVGGDATLLPLLQVTLTSLWDDPPRRLTLDRYHGLTAALESTADRVYAYDRQGQRRPDADCQAIVSIFLDLVEVSLDDDARRDVRRSVPKPDLLRDHPERGPLVDELIAARLLSASAEGGADPTIDIIHETLLSNWTRLRQAIEDQREALQSRERFRLALHQWIEHDQSDEYLLQGVGLAEARELATRRDIVTYDSLARALLERSAAKEEERRQHELDQARALAAEQQARAEDSARSARRLRIWLIAAVSAALAAVVAAGLAVNASNLATTQARINASRELAAESSTVLLSDPELSILLAREAELRAPTQQAEDALRLALVGSPARVAVRGPGSPLGKLAINPDGTSFAASDDDGSVHVWNAQTGAKLFDIAAHHGPLSAIDWSHDGRALLTASSTDSAARLWDARSGAALGELAGPPGGTYAAAFSPDGQRVATGGTDGTARVFSTANAQVLAELPGHTGPIASLSFDGAGTRLVTAGLDQTARVWTLTGSPSSVALRGHQGLLVDAAFDPTGQRLVTASADGTARVWNASTGATELELRGHVGPLTSAAFSPSGNTVLTSGIDGTARVWDATSGALMTELRGHTGPLASASFDASGSRVLTASYDGTARLWSALDPSQSLELRGHSRELTSARFSPDGQLAITTSLDGTARTWLATRTQEWLTLRGHARKIYSVAFSPDGQRLATGGVDNSLRIWRTDGARTSDVRQFGVPVTTVAFSPDGGRVAVGLFDGTAHLVAASSNEGDQTLRGHTDWVHTVAFSPDGQRLVTASRDGTARIWDAASGNEMARLSPGAGEVFSATFDPLGRTLATSNADGATRVWDADTQQPILTLHGHTGVVFRVEFSPDGRLLATAGADGTVRIWGASDGREVATLRGHAGAVYGAKFSGDGALLVSVGADHGAVVWDARTWQRVTGLPGQTGEVLDVAIAPDSQQVATVGEDGLARIYSRELFAPIQEALGLVPSRVTRQPADLRPDERAMYLHE